MQTHDKHNISTIEQLRAVLPGLLDRVNSDRALALAAAANPLLFLKEMGYSLSREVTSEIEERGRFSKSQIVQRRKAIARINRIAKEEADLSSSTTMVALFVKLGLDNVRPDMEGSPGTPGVLSFSEAMLSRNRSRHPLYGALLDLRKIEASSRRFAPDAAYADIRSGKVRIPGLALKARLSPKPKGGRSTRSTNRDA